MLNHDILCAARPARGADCPAGRGAQVRVRAPHLASREQQQGNQTAGPAAQEQQLRLQAAQQLQYITSEHEGQYNFPTTYLSLLCYFCRK